MGKYQNPAIKEKEKLDKKERLKKQFQIFKDNTKESFAVIGRAMKEGDFKTRLSFLIMGFGNLCNKQIIKGLLYLFIEVAFIMFMVTFASGYLANLLTLGTNAQGQVFDEELGIFINVQGDNSMLILLFSIMSLFVIAGFIALYLSSIKSAYKAQLTRESGKKPNSFRQDVIALINDKFHVTLLTLPVLGAIAFTVLPLVFMILIAFTNFDKNHQPPGNIFTWIGLQNFKDIFWGNPVKSNTFFGLLGWTLVWAVLATASNYILGMILALMINKKGIRFKKLWRTVFVITIAVPSFVTLMLMSRMLAELGPINVVLQNLGWISSPIPFLTDVTWARITVLVVNIWVGIPYTMLITTGILMNIPEDMYEAAKIDGAGPVKAFLKITLPYMIFVTTPYLITQFIGNINNFNVIYLLTGGGPFSLDYYQAGKTDLLVTWLYKLTVTQQDYSLASTIGILVFIICSIISLITYNLSASTRKEDQFQ